MAKYLTQAMLVLADDHPHSQAATATALRYSPHTVAMVAKKGTSVPGVKDVRVAGRGGTNVDGLFKQAADELIPWIVMRRSLAEPPALLSQALMATGRHSNKAIPGFAVLFSGPQDRPIEKILAVVDRADESLSGMMVLASVAMATLTNAHLDVLMIGAKGETVPREQPRESLRATRSKEMLDRAKRMADDAPGTANWMLVDHVEDRTRLVLDQVEQGGYDLVVDDLGALRLGGRMGRGGRIKKVLGPGGPGETPLALLTRTDASVLLVLDGVQLGVIPPIVVKGGAGAVLALGIAAAAAPVSMAAGRSQTSLSQQVDQTQLELEQVTNPQTTAVEATGAEAPPVEVTAEQVSAQSADSAESDDKKDDGASVEDFQDAQEQEAEAKSDMKDAEKDLDKALEESEDTAAAIEDTVESAEAISVELAAAEAAHQQAVAHSEDLQRQASGVSGVLNAPTDEELAAAEADVANTAAALAEVEQEAARTVDQHEMATQDAADAHEDLAEAAADAQEAATAYEEASGNTADIEDQLADVRISPIAEGDYSESAHYGDHGSAWSTGMHTGEDYAAPEGTEVVAAASGTVVYAGFDGAYGNRVVIEHEDGYYTTYNHLSAITVSVGEEVTVGEKVGEVGNTGNSFGAHLHFEVTKGGDGWTGGQFLDPDEWLADSA